MLNIAVLVSGGGTNLQAILDSIEKGYLDKVRVSLVLSSREGVYALERAANAGIETVVLEKKNYKSIEAYDAALMEALKPYAIDLVVMAGFLVILGEQFTRQFKNRIINVHPSLIPAFCGVGFYGMLPHEKALEYGVKIAGATVHFVEREADAGPIILQKAVEIWEDDTPESLQRRVMEEVEWKILPQAIRLFRDKRLRIEGRKVRVLDENKM